MFNLIEKLSEDEFDIIYSSPNKDEVIEELDFILSNEFLDDEDKTYLRTEVYSIIETFN